MQVIPKSNTVLTQAFNQWANRPADQRFSSLEALHDAVQHHRDVATEATSVSFDSLRVDGSGEAPVLIGSAGVPAKFTHWSFGQLALKVGAPASYLRQLPAALAAENMNHGLRRVATEFADRNDDDEKTAKLLFAKNGDVTVRAITSDKYTRIWNRDITARLLRLTKQHPEWQPAPAAFDGSRGLYASDQDVFAFLVDNDRRIFESGPGGGLGRGFFVSNSEVGASSFVVTTFWYEYICGNHRVWGAQGVAELRIRHRGNADERAFDQLTVELKKYADASAVDDEAKVQQARTFRIAAKKDDVLDKVFGLRVPSLSRALIAESYDKAKEHDEWYGDPRTAWGLAGGITEIARDLPNANERVALDRAAGKVMQMAF